MIILLLNSWIRQPRRIIRLLTSSSFKYQAQNFGARFFETGKVDKDWGWKAAWEEIGWTDRSGEKLSENPRSQSSSREGKGKSIGPRSWGSKFRCREDGSSGIVNWHRSDHRTEQFLFSKKWQRLGYIFYILLPWLALISFKAHRRKRRLGPSKLFKMCTTTPTSSPSVNLNFKLDIDLLLITLSTFTVIAT